MAITMGDASGVGPEIVLRRFAAGGLGDDVVVYGDAAILRHGAELLGLDVEIDVIDRPRRWRSDRARCTSSTPGCSRPPTTARACSTPRRAPPPGTTSLSATDDALAGRVAGIVTMPMNKEATQLSDPGVRRPHRVDRRSVRRAARDDDADALATLSRVTHVSTHCSLREAIERVRRDVCST